ncbi:Phosphatidylinositol 3-kinase VPS34 [Babesia sp. Xinjiang]|uniref:Phosphatidylinositol 3-kinase VPS34 n=1 Tax=Babesia sp. Xinjiang TaxID=462227 RepID=UPI000A262E34|nr:Phosphatidylinositol 3-kinase VPS34 [Babesia sp. Xinjiang]ORM40388.1 Phosphatidylinositol 3-kinase VPS34 [Babesia sp. Xinjiang]
MKHENQVSRCHLAGLIKDIMPPDPRIHLNAVASRELTLSIGSLVLLRSPNEIKSRRINHESSVSSPSDSSDTVGVDSPSNKCPFRARKTEILLKCSLFNNMEQVADTVTIKLNRGDITGLREVVSGPNSRRVKHRRTYSGGSSTRPLTGINFVRCKLRYSGSTGWCFRIKRCLDCYVTPSTVANDLSEESWYTAFSKGMRNFGWIRQSNLPESTEAAVERLARSSCRHCRLTTTRQEHRISVPLVVHVDNVLRFPVWNTIRDGCTNLTFKSEIYVAGKFFASSELEIAPKSCNIDCFANLFFEQRLHTTPRTETCNIRSCCCSAQKRVVCASHIIKILEEIKRIISFLFRYGISIDFCMLGKYRYLLYFYFQTLAFSGYHDLERCIDAFPIAILTVGIVEFDEFKGQVKTNPPLSGRLRGHKATWSKVSPPITVANDPTVGEKASDLNKTAHIKLESLFQQAEIRYRKYRRRRPVANTYIGETCDESSIVGIHLNVFPAMNMPICSMPTTLTFLMGSEFYRDEYLICPMMMDTLCIHSNIFIAGSGIVFIPEPDEVSFLRSLVSTPLYSVGVEPEKLDTFKVTTPWKTIGYRQVNEMIWQYLPLLAKTGETLGTFLRFVDWGATKESGTAIRAMYMWKEPELATLLELMSRDFAPTRVPEVVQKYASKILIRKYGIRKLIPFFPQLVVAPGVRHLVDDLIKMACKEHITALQLYWALDCWGKRQPHLNDVLGRLIAAIERGDSGSDVLGAIKSQRVLRQRIHFLMQHLKSSPYTYAEKRLMLDKALNSGNSLDVFYGLGPSVDEQQRITFDTPIPLFTNPALNIRAIDTDKCNVIKTTHYPLLLTLFLDGSENHRQTYSKVERVSSSSDTGCRVPQESTKSFVKRELMFKDGDDLRLDQVCQQIAKLSDIILRNHGIKSYIKTYEVLATSAKDGFVDFLMDTKPLSAVLADHGTIESYLFGNGPSFFDALWKRLNFIGSLASYSAITYLLGVGDRHNDNLIVSNTGHVVHVDYGYVLGSDPKPLPAPPFKLSQELLDFLGGHDSFFYRRFKKRFYVVFSILRRHAKLILILLYLLLDCNLRNVDLQAVVNMESKFHLSENSLCVSRNHVNSLIEYSANALSSVLHEKWHQFAMAWK